MLYHRLLSRLVSSESSFDFMIFWQLANVDSARQFTWSFLEEAGLIADHEEFQVLTLADLSVVWQDLIHQLRIARVDDQLKVIYRHQSHKPHGESSHVPPNDPPTKTIERSLETSGNQPTENGVVTSPVEDNENTSLPPVQG